MDKKPVIIAIEFDCELRIVKPMVDHTFNIILNVPEYYREQAKMAIDKIGDEIHVVIV